MFVTLHYRLILQFSCNREHNVIFPSVSCDITVSMRRRKIECGVGVGGGVGGGGGGGGGGIELQLTDKVV